MKSEGEFLSWLIVLLTFLLASFKSSKANTYQKVAVILPAFNEGENVAAVISVIKGVDYVDEIIVVDDGSTDNTADEVRKSGVTLLTHEKNKGKGEAIKTGYKYSDADILAFIDADIQNLTERKVDAIIRPILEGKTEITKTKFSRESGRVTELTAKPLLNFFFPEISFEQPLSGQFAAKKSVLKKINFEPDYGVDVGIVLDADVQGISIQEVDIGGIEHDMSPLADLHLMANEVVRTIINRANKYGRVIMIDDIGYFIRMTIVGLSLIILGLFMIFFVKFCPLELGVLVVLVGIIMTIYYLIKVVVKSIHMFKRIPKGNLIKSFVKIHFPVLVSAIILILMISTFLGAATFDNGSISIEPTSRNLILFSDDSDDAISVRGPYSVDSAFSNEPNILRIPIEALESLGLSYGDTLIVDNRPYTLNQTTLDEVYVMRLPVDVKKALELSDGDVIQNSRLTQTFEGCVAIHNVSENSEFVLSDSYIISSRQESRQLNVTVDNQSLGSVSGIFIDNQTYDIEFNGTVIGSLYYQNNSFSNDSYMFTNNGHEVNIDIADNHANSIQQFLNSQQGHFLQISQLKKVNH